MMTRILGIDYSIDPGTGIVNIEQGTDMGNDGDVSHVELHPIFLRLLCEEAGLVGRPSTGLVPDSVVGRLCLIADRMDDLQQELIKLDLQPYSQPSDQGRVVLNDLDQLLCEMGISTEMRKERAAVEPKATGKPATAPGTTGSLL